MPPATGIPSEVLEMAARLDVLKHLPEVIKLTREVFGDFTHVTAMEDPECLGDDHIEFHVRANGSIDEILDKEEQWGRRMQEIIPRSPQVYLVFSDFRS